VRVGKASIYSVLAGGKKSHIEQGNVTSKSRRLGKFFPYQVRLFR
jgi:hypothetical protein